MKLRTKILGGYAILLILMIVVWSWAVASLFLLGRAGEAILQENFASILAAENMIDFIERQDSAVLLLLLGYEEEGRAQFRGNEVEFAGWLGRARGNITIAGEEKVIAAIAAGYRDYLASYARISQFLPAGRQQAGGYYHETMLLQFQQVRDACLALREMNQQAMVEASARAHQTSRRTIVYMTGIGVVTGGLGLFFSILLSGILMRPLSAMSQATERIAEGDYEVKLEVASRDELGQLARRIMTMSHKLKAFHELNVGRLVQEKRKGEAILRSIGDGLIVVDEELRVTAINPEACKIAGRSHAEATGRHFFDLIRDQALFERVEQTAASGTTPESGEDQGLLRMEKEGAELFFRTTVTPVKSEGGETVQGVVVLLQDVTRLKELERLKSEFVLAASHELKTPLTGLAMSIALLEEESTGKTPRERELLLAAREETERLRALVADLLDLSRIESGRIEMEIVPVAATVLIEKAFVAFQSQTQAAGIELTQSVPDDLPPALADPNKITWVLSNLLSNALRYTPRGGHIRMRAEQGGGWLYLSVCDDGAGIPVEYQSRVFEKFIQVKGDHQGGSGLGLAICREIVRAHGGNIWVESFPGKGSTFTFTLKAAPGAGLKPNREALDA
ncbi:KinB sensor domain-containing domain [Desulfuromonas carbonis]|uniref:sensor histidine kinase n=1 Tax=Desulfuromonas sp. DDH964 TaxID=1823759 RepID=UPI00078B3D12|nr:ATP-binding protein [Desulfuromonas sp. DDH964]AMV70941.1 sensor histidine kinase, HAMP and PAS domain-containing [Desulfuromonas sp. DDH964]